MRCDLSQQVALVTGAAQGIGRAIADRFAANGATVVYTDRDGAGAAQAAAQAPRPSASDQSRQVVSAAPSAGSAGQGRACGWQMDVTEDGQVETVLVEVVRRYRHLDILVNNAGVNTLKHRVNIDEFPLEEWERILAVDLTGLFRVSRLGARPMIRQRRGRIINIASVFGVVPARVQCAFVAAKAGVVNLTKAMALELGPQGILVNGIAPGSILTAGTQQLFYSQEGKWNDRVAQMLAHVPLGRPGTPEEVACAALFLADPENSYTNGHILVVDGGWTAGYHREF